MKKLLVLAVLPTMALAACHGLSKADFSKFCEKVDAACKETPEVKQVKISGKYDGEKVKLTYDIPQTAGSALDSLVDGLTGKYNRAESAAISVAIAEKTPSGYTVKEDENLKYYTGMGFKVVDEKKNTVEWNGKGLLASVKGENTSLNFTWVKK